MVTIGLWTIGLWIHIFSTTYILHFDFIKLHIKRYKAFNKISIFYYLRWKSIRIINAVKLKMRRR